MSRIGKLPITVPEKVTVTVNKNNVTIEGPKGKLEQKLMAKIDCELSDNIITLIRQTEEKETIAFHGLMRSLINNMVVGVSVGFEKQLEIQGVGYRAAVKGKDLELNLGFSHQVVVKAEDNITFSCDGNTKVKVSGIDKQRVGQIAANIRALRPPEPYKGKGVRYFGEEVRRKAGKSNAS